MIIVIWFLCLLAFAICSGSNPTVCDNRNSRATPTDISYKNFDNHNFFLFVFVTAFILEMGFLAFLAFGPANPPFNAWLVVRCLNLMSMQLY